MFGEQRPGSVSGETKTDFSVDDSQLSPLNSTINNLEESNMSSKVPTFEEVDAHIQAADLSKIQPPAAAGAAAAVPNVCAAYKVVKPFLQLAANFPFIPKKWRDAITAFMNVLK